MAAVPNRRHLPLGFGLRTFGQPLLHLCHAEFVSLGVGHHDPLRASLGMGLGVDRSQVGESLDLCREVLRHKIEMHTILATLPCSGAEPRAKRARKVVATQCCPSSDRR